MYFSKVFVWSVVFFVVSVNRPVCAHRTWTTTYQFPRERFKHVDKKNIIVEKNNSFSFTQLIISWNSLPFKKGFFRFFLEIFDEKNLKWATYKIYEWGADRHRSFMHKDPYGDQYAYVRFESAPGKSYNRFRIKVVALHVADPQALQHITVNASHIPSFTPEPLNKLEVKEKKKYITGVPCISQHYDAFPESSGWCSPASLAQVIQFYTHTLIDLPQFAREVYDHGLQVYGSWPFNIAQAALYLDNYYCYVTHLASIYDLFTLLLENKPVIVSICSSKMLPGAPKAYDQGHLITVVGFDLIKKEIICHDTAEKEPCNCIKHYPLINFIRAWEQRHRLAYVIVPKKV